MTTVGANLAQWIKPIYHSQLTTEYDWQKKFYPERVLGGLLSQKVLKL